MTTKKLIIAWLCLLALAGIGYKVHEAKHQALQDIGEGKYVPVSDEVAMGEYIKNCSSVFECNYLYADPTERDMRMAQGAHKDDFYKNRFDPEIRMTQQRYRMYLEISLWIMAAMAAMFLLWWCRATLFPILARWGSTLRARANMAGDLKSLANRRVRQAEADFITLKNLHDNGLISDVMFNQRKEELKAALTENQVFQTKQY